MSEEGHFGAGSTEYSQSDLKKVLDSLPQPKALFLNQVLMNCPLSKPISSYLGSLACRCRTCRVIVLNMITADSLVQIDPVNLTRSLIKFN
ncbi:hypothetical protein J6590_011747 [Homalodisca vitripennis]|nr:hypothetical protein J6590_011747 [Homalodisca vitripennis]